MPMVNVKDVKYCHLCLHLFYILSHPVTFHDLFHITLLHSAINVKIIIVK